MSQSPSHESTTKVTLPSSFVAVVTVIRLELSGRARSRKWILAMVAWVAVLAVMWLGFSTLSDLLGSGRYEDNASVTRRIAQGGFIALLYFTLTISLIVSPSLSSTSINGDREHANLAILQAAPLSTGQLLWGKLLSAWLGGAAFILVAAVPLGVIALTHDLGFGVLGRTICFLLIESFVVCAIGLGFSALIPRPVHSVLATFLSIVTISAILPLGFTFLSDSLRETGSYNRMVLSYQQSYYDRMKEQKNWELEPKASEKQCQPEKQLLRVTHTEKAWLMLGVSPYLMMPDAIEGDLTRTQLRSQLAQAKRKGKGAWATNFLGSSAEYLARMRAGNPSLQDEIDFFTDASAPRISRSDACYVDETGAITEVPSKQILGPEQNPRDKTRSDFLDYLGTSWIWGMGLHLLLAAGALTTAWLRLKTPIRRLPPGVRIA